jgi:hypothetical protein
VDWSGYRPGVDLEPLARVASIGGARPPEEVPVAKNRFVTPLLLIGTLALLAMASAIVALSLRGPVATPTPRVPTRIALATRTATPTVIRPARAANTNTPLPPTITPTVYTGPNALTPGKLNLSATFASIGVELFFSGDDNANASAALEFKPTSATTWRAGLPLWAVGADAPAPGRAFYGSALLLEAGTKYDVRITFTDPEGVLGQRVVTGSITTRAEDVPPASKLAPTHFVSPTGDDKADGSATAPWRTLDQALTAAPSGAIVQVAPGSYAPPTAERKSPLTLVAQRPAVDDNRDPIAGPHTVIEPQTFAAPAGTAGAAAPGPWTAVTLTGPATGAQYKVWKWTGSPVKNATRLTIAADRAAVPQRIAYWDRKSGTKNGYTMESPAGWAELLYKNETYNYGFASFDSDVYLRLPGDRDPNGSYVTVHAEPVGQGKGRIVFDVPNIRLSGFEIRTTDIWYGPGSSGGIVDHNLLLGAGLTYVGTQGTTSTYSADQLVERNRFVDTGLWSVDPANPAIPWNFIKTALRLNGAATDWSRVGAEAETTAIGARGGAKRTVVRYNTIDGFFNGVGVYNEGFDRYAQQDADVYNNLVQHISDDSFEPEQQAINWRVWNNRLEEVSTALSTGPVAYGPVYFFRNEVWRLGSRGVGADGRGDKGVGVVAFKFSGQSKPAARVYVINNTFWTDQPGADGGNQYAGGGANSERFYLRNNIFRMTRYAFAPPVNGAKGNDRWDEDYDFFFTSDPARGINYGSNRLDLAAYRTASGQGSNANRADPSGAFRTEPALTDAPNGNLTIAAGSPLIDAGVVVPNIADRPGIDYQGNAPDLGAKERP